MDAEREAREQSKVGSENSTGTTSTTGQTVNPDPNSADPVLGKTELPKACSKLWYKILSKLKVIG
jgi:hypothetical protein